MEGHALISSEVVASYAADAAREVDGVTGLAGAVKVSGEQATPALEVHVELAWGAEAPEVGQAVQDRVIAYLARMADVRPATVDVVIAAVGAPPAA